MKKILIIGGRIEPSISANVVCLYNVFSIFNDDLEIHFLGMGNDSKSFVRDGIITHMMKYNYEDVVSQNSIFDIIYLPDTQHELTVRKTQYAIELNKKNHFDMVVGICSTYSNIYAAITLKKENPGMLAIGYYMDTIDSLFQRKGLLRSLVDKISYYGEKKAFKELDQIILPVSSKQIYEKEEFLNFQSKMHFLEFPTYISKPIRERKGNRNELINMVLFGSLNRSFRNPEAILKILAKVSEESELKIELNVYGDNDKTLFESIENCRNIKYVPHGRVNHEELLDKISKADVLLNVSNSSMTAVPSKIFEMFSSYRPILTYIADESDSALKYYKLYPECFIYNGKLTYDAQSEKLIDFLKKSQNVNVDKELVDKLFIENTPQYVAEKVKEILNIR